MGGSTATAKDRPPEITISWGKAATPRSARCGSLRSWWRKTSPRRKASATRQSSSAPGTPRGRRRSSPRRSQRGRPETFEAQMDARAAEAGATSPRRRVRRAFRGLRRLLAARRGGRGTQATGAAAPLFPDTFTYSVAMLERLSRSRGGVFRVPASVYREERLIRLTIPEDMRARDRLDTRAKARSMAAICRRRLLAQETASS